MKQLPYYPYYPRDFSESKAVLKMNLSEIGLYQMCLNFAWEHGHIPDDRVELARLLRQDLKTVRAAWQKVALCWVPNGTPGYLVNERMEQERENANQIVAGKSKGAAKTNAKRWGNRLADRIDDRVAERFSERVTERVAEVSLRASGSGSVSDSESQGRGAGEGADNPLYERYHDLVAQWPHPDGVDEGMRMWIVLVDSAEVTSQTIDQVFDGLERYKSSKKFVQGFRMRVDKWLSGRRWKDHPEPAGITELEAQKWA